MYVFSDELRKAYEALANTGKRDIINKIEKINARIKMGEQ